MSCTRRRFIKSVGVTIASLIVTQALPACTPQGSDDESQPREHPAWGRLRQSWLDLGALKGVSLGSDWEKVQATVDEHKTTHQAALDELLEAGEIDKTVADQVQLAFIEGVYHVERSLTLCYIAIPFEHDVRVDLLQQADVLGQLADELDLDQSVVAQAQDAIARDVTFFQAVKAGKVERTQIEQQFQADQLQASPEATQAARVLVDLLLEQTE